MRKIVLNERDLLNEALEFGKIADKYTDTAAVLVRYYFSLGYTKNEVYNNVNKFLIDNMEGYRPDIEYVFLKGFIDNIEKGGRFSLVNINRVHITKKEWAVISSISNDKAARVAFVLLIYAKVISIKNKGKNSWISVSTNDIFKEASIQSNDTSLFLMNELSDMGLIQMRMQKNNKKNTTVIQVKFLDLDSTSEIHTYIDPSKKIVTYFYELYKGWKYKVCEVCNERFKVAKTGRTPKYCSKCSKDKEKEKKLNYYHKSKINE